LPNSLLNMPFDLPFYLTGPPPCPPVKGGALRRPRKKIFDPQSPACLAKNFFPWLHP
jgi:hypothetical protein